MIFYLMNTMLWGRKFSPANLHCNNSFFLLFLIKERHVTILDWIP